jgi:hypothetical protein
MYITRNFVRAFVLAVRSTHYLASSSQGLCNHNHLNADAFDMASLTPPPF